MVGGLSTEGGNCTSEGEITSTQGLILVISVDCFLSLQMECRYGEIQLGKQYSLKEFSILCLFRFANGFCKKVCALTNSHKKNRSGGNL